jgi:predicted nucleic acid-binding protein
VSRLFLDSSVIIDHLRDRSTPESDALARWLGQREMFIGDMVLLEVLQGVREPHLLRQVEAIMANFRCLGLGGEARAREAAGVYRLLREKGVTPRSTIDVLIASFCTRENMELLASDRDFRLMAPHIGLILAGPTVS